MRICIDARPIINEQTGLGRYTYNIINGLKKNDKHNDYLILVDMNLHMDHPVFEQSNDHFIYKKCPIRGVSVKQQYKLEKYLRNEEIDVYHYPHFDLPIAISKTYKSVFTVHDLTHLLHRNFFKGADYLKRVYTKQIMRVAIRHAVKIIVVSDSTKNDLIKYFNLTYSLRNKVITIYEAAEPYFKPVTDEKIKEQFKLKWNLHKPYFLFIGERRPHKNLTRQIEAFRHFLNMTKQDMEFIIIGKPYKKYYEAEKKAKQLRCEHNVRFLGYIVDNDIPMFYNCASAFMFVSLYEGFGIPILEAMACGTPVITSNISSTKEIAGQAGLLVNPYQVDEIARAMQKIVMYKTLRKCYINNGLDRVKEFSWESAAKKTLQLYQEVHLLNR